MKEIQLQPETSIEVKANKDQEKKYNYIGSITLQPGQKLFSFNMETMEFKQVDLKDEQNYVWGTDVNQKPVKRIRIEAHILYVPAINEKNAKRKILKKFGFQFNTNGQLHNVDMPVKVVKQFVEVDSEGNMREVEAPEEIQNNQNHKEK